MKTERYWPRPEDETDSRELFDQLYGVVSGTECTGLIPAAPHEASEIHSYSEIYDIPLSVDQSSGCPEEHTEPGEDGIERKLSRSAIYQQLGEDGR